MRFATLSLVALLAPFATGTLEAQSLSARTQRASDRYSMRIGARTPDVVARHRGLTVTRMSAEQVRTLDALGGPRARADGARDGAIADVVDLAVIQFLYLESPCEDTDAMAIRGICGEPCNMIGLRWNENEFHETVSIIVDGEEIAQVDGLPDPPGGATNAFNIFGIDAGEHTFRIEELDTGTVDEVAFTVGDRQPFANPGSVTCEQGAVEDPGAACELVATWGSTNTPRATSFLVYINGAASANVPGNFGGVVFAGAPAGEYCIDVRGSFEPAGSEGDQIYIGCRVVGACCTVSCEEIACPAVGFLDVCQSTYGGPEGTGSVIFDWVNPEGLYPEGVEVLVGGEPVLGIENNPDDGSTPARVTITPFANGDTTLGIRGNCGDDIFSDPVEVAIEILPETPYTAPNIGAVVCSFDPELPDPNDPDSGELVPATTATWTNNPDSPAAFIDVYIEEGDTGEIFFVGTGPGTLEDVSIWPSEPGDGIVLQFFGFFETGCYGSELVSCGEEEDPVFFIRGVCSSTSGRSPQIADAVRLLQWRFAGGPPGPCQIACDTDGDGRIEIADALRILNFLFRGGVPPFGWSDSTAVCERFERAAPGFDFGCEEPNERCSEAGPLE